MSALPERVLLATDGSARIFNLCLVGPLVGGYFDGRKNLEARPPETRREAPQH